MLIRPMFSEPLNFPQRYVDLWKKVNKNKGNKATLRESSYDVTLFAKLKSKAVF